MSVSMPDVGSDPSRVMDSTDDNLITTKFHLKDFKTCTSSRHTCSVKTSAVLARKWDIVDGVGFMKALIDEMDWQITNTLAEDATDGDGIKDAKRPNFRWEGHDAILERKKVAHVAVHGGKVQFIVQYLLAYRMGWLSNSVDGKVSLGANLRYSFHDKTAGTWTHPTTELDSGRL